SSLRIAQFEELKEAENLCPARGAIQVEEIWYFAESCAWRREDSAWRNGALIELRVAHQI
ncbi:hypothetical protein A2U01_0018297, partial [Trifolium medium]|nr:hypothetical protein [Trifolium medium]